MVGIVSRKRSAKSHATPSVVTRLTNHNAAIALTRRRAKERRRPSTPLGTGHSTALGVAAAIGAIAEARGADDGTGSVGGTATIGGSSVSAIERALPSQVDGSVPSEVEAPDPSKPEEPASASATDRQHGTVT